MRLQQTLCAIILLVSSITAADATTPDWPSAPAAPVDRAHVKTLIDQLTSISAEGVGFSTMANARVFSPVDAEPQFAGGIMGTRAPSTPAPVKELVSLGIKALPELIDHVDDKRKTAFVARAFMGGMWYRNEFETRPTDRVPNPAGTTNSQRQIGKTDDIDQYTVTVGDVCFATIGQIVNRDYSAARYQPTGCEVINSTTHTPALAAAVRAEWAGLTDAEFKRSLIADAEEPGFYRVGAAVKRLCYYYPKDGKRLALRMLKRPLCDAFLSYDFVTDDLLDLPVFVDKDILDPDRMGASLGHPETPFLKQLVDLAGVDVRFGSDLDYPGEGRDKKVGAIVDLLLALQDRHDLYFSADFSGVRLRPSTKHLLATASTELDHCLANRRLLEDVFPTQLARCPDPSSDPAIWRAKLNAFVRQHGARYRPEIWRDINGSLNEQGRTRSGPVIAERARIMIRVLYPKIDPNRPGFLNAADVPDRQSMIDEVMPFHDKDMESTVLHLLRAATPSPAQFASDVELDGDDETFGVSCVTYLNGRGYKSDCQKFLEMWLAVERRDRAKLKLTDPDVDQETRTIDGLRHMLTNLK